MPLTVERCPNCLAPLELDPSGACRFCGARVSESDDDSEEDDADVIIRRLGIGESDASLLQPASAVIVVLRYAAYDGRARQFLEAQRALVPLLCEATRIASRRARDAGATNEDVFNRGDKIYTPDEWWTFDLAMDFLIALSRVDGIDADVKSDLATKVKVFDERWSGIVKKALKHALGPTPIQPFRSAIARRSE